MKTKLIIFTAVLLVFVGGMTSCEKKKCQCQELMNQPAMSCMERSFIEGCSIFLSENTDVNPWYSSDKIFFIKGKTLETVENHGLKVRLIEDLKENFPKDVNTFTVWGTGIGPGNGYDYFFTSNSRADWLTTDWKEGDTLLMLLTSVDKEKAEATMNMCCMPEEIQSQWFERPGDFRTMMCTPSVVKLSEDYVIGRLLFTWDGDIPYLVREMPRKEFDERLQKILNSKQ